jgi:hypothetical protein
MSELHEFEQRLIARSTPSTPGSITQQRRGRCPSRKLNYWQTSKLQSPDSQSVAAGASIVLAQSHLAHYRLPDSLSSQAFSSAMVRLAATARSLLPASGAFHASKAVPNSSWIASASFLSSHFSMNGSS